MKLNAPLQSAAADVTFDLNLTKIKLLFLFRNNLFGFPQGLSYIVFQEMFPLFFEKRKHISLTQTSANQLLI